MLAEESAAAKKKEEAPTKRRVAKEATERKPVVAKAVEKTSE